MNRAAARKLAQWVNRHGGITAEVISDGPWPVGAHAVLISIPATQRLSNGQILHCIETSLVTSWRDAKIELGY